MVSRRAPRSTTTPRVSEEGSSRWLPKRAVAMGAVARLIEDPEAFPGAPKLRAATLGAVLTKLASLAQHSTVCFAAQPTIAAAARCCRRTVQLAINELEARGLIIVERRHRQGRTNTIRINWTHRHLRAFARLVGGVRTGRNQLLSNTLDSSNTTRPSDLPNMPTMTMMGGNGPNTVLPPPACPPDYLRAAPPEVIDGIRERLAARQGPPIAYPRNYWRKAILRELKNLRQMTGEKEPSEDKKAAIIEQLKALKKRRL